MSYYERELKRQTQEMRRQSDLLRRYSQTQRVNHLYGGGKRSRGSWVPGGVDPSKITEEDWKEFHRIGMTEGGEAAIKFIQKKGGAWPTLAPLGLVLLIMFLVSWLSSVWIYGVPC